MADRTPPAHEAPIMHGELPPVAYTPLGGVLLVEQHDKAPDLEPDLPEASVPDKVLDVTDPEKVHDLHLDSSHEHSYAEWEDPT